MKKNRSSYSEQIVTRKNAFQSLSSE